MLLKNLIILAIVLWGFHTSTFCQKIGNSKGKNSDVEYSMFRDTFLAKQISHSSYYSNDIIVPVVIAYDKYRIKIKSEYLHRYLTVALAKNGIESNSEKHLLDSAIYISKVIDIIKGKEKLIFNPAIFNMFVEGGTYYLYDKPNPYTANIKRNGIKKFISTIFEKNELIRGDNVTYTLKYIDTYSKVNEYGLNYLIEALFEHNFKFESGDGVIGFTYIGCKKSITN